jgi:single-strand DNA-binding protein
MANDLNSAVLVGRLTKDPELKYSQSGTAIMECCIAVNRRTKKGDQWVDDANFFDFTYMGKGAEAVSKYAKKGGQVGIKGELKQERWEKDGVKHSRVKVHVDSLQLLGSKPEGQQSGSVDSGDFEDDIPF